MREKHYCKDCGNLAYGFCIVHKAKVRGRTFSDCIQFVQAENKESIASQRENRKKAEKHALQKHDDELARKLRLRKLERERAIKWRQKQENERRQRQENNAKQVVPNEYQQVIHDKRSQWAKDQLAIMENSTPSNKHIQIDCQQHVKKHPSPMPKPLSNNKLGYFRPKAKTTLKDRDVRYVMNVQGEAFLDRYLKVEKERNILRDKLERITDRLQFDAQGKRQYVLYKEATEENSRYKKKLKHIITELKERISLLSSYPTSDVTAQRAFMNYMFELLRICEKDSE